MRGHSCSRSVFPPTLRQDGVTEAAEMYQNAGEKGLNPADPDAPPRRRAHTVKGHGTWDNARPPSAGVVGRESGELRLGVCPPRDRQTLHPCVAARPPDTATVYTDEGQAYHHLPQTGRGPASVGHPPGQREWARDDDGDGVGEVHGNTREGIWPGLRNFLRLFRGVNKEYLGQYTAVFQGGDNLKEITPALLRAMMVPCTSGAT